MSQVSLSEFADKLNEILPVIIKEFARRQANELYKGKITLPQFVILDFLQKGGEAKMTELAQITGVTTAAMTGIVDRLVRDNYALRNPSPNDRRIIKIRITSKGAELTKRINRQRRQMIIEIFGKLSERERKDYIMILKHIYDILLPPRGKQDNA